MAVPTEAVPPGSFSSGFFAARQYCPTVAAGVAEMTQGCGEVVRLGDPADRSHKELAALRPSAHATVGFGAPFS